MPSINTELLDKAIKKSGVKTTFIYEKLGLSGQGFYKKKKGVTKWRAAEIYVMQDILRLTDLETQEIFYPESTLQDVPEKR